MSKFDGQPDCEDKTALRLSSFNGQGVKIMSDLLDDKEAATKAVVEFIKGKSKTKSKFYFKDFYKVFPDDKPRAIKKIINKLVTEEVLEYWSSGSTTMYGLAGAGKQHSSEGEE